MMPSGIQETPMDKRQQRQQFHALLKQHLFPVLRSHGFRGSGTTFRRCRGEVIQLLNIQGARDGGSCCVNLGIHLSFLPVHVTLTLPDARKISEPDCEFRRRLAPAGEADYWWKYFRTEEAGQASVRHLVEVYQAGGVSYFDRYATFPGLFGLITPRHLVEQDYSLFPCAVVPSRAALTMARIALHLGRRDDAEEFVRIGLAAVGSEWGLKWELERVLDEG
jgi:hypothetical protein